MGTTDFRLRTVVEDFLHSTRTEECNARKVNCSCEHIETSSLWAEFINKNICLSVRLVFKEVKSIEF